MTRSVFAVVVTAGLTSLTVTPAAQAPSVPLRKGLTVVTAVHQELGDFESIKVVTLAGPDTVEISYAADVLDPFTDEIRQTRARRSVRRADLADAHEYAQGFSARAPRLMPGTTALGVSAAVLTELKTRGETTLTTDAGGLAGGVGGLIGGLVGDSSDDARALGKIRGTLARVETTRVEVPVIVNDVPVSLPAVHAKGTLGDDEAEFFFLDDPDNPLALRFSIGDETLTVVKIAFPADDPVPSIERALDETGRAEVYGIYFDFASDQIKPESRPVLDEIAALLAKNPSWTLDVEGHTDDIGGDEYNLALSKARAAAVKAALVGTYRVAPDRLTTAGFGASRPKASNDTLEGRARNRRVELVRR